MNNQQIPENEQIQPSNSQGFNELKIETQINSSQSETSSQPTNELTQRTIRTNELSQRTSRRVRNRFDPLGSFRVRGSTSRLRIPNSLQQLDSINQSNSIPDSINQSNSIPDSINQSNSLDTDLNTPLFESDIGMMLDEVIPTEAEAPRRGFLVYVLNNHNSSQVNMPGAFPPELPTQEQILSAIMPILRTLLTRLHSNMTVLPMLPENDEALDYEFLTRLDEIFGVVVPNNADQRDIDDQIPILRYSLDPAIRQIPTKALKESDCFVPLCLNDLLSDTCDKCNICLQDYEDDEPLRILNCRHGFHQACLDNWLTTSKNNCPMCRAECTTRTRREPDSEQQQQPQPRQLFMLLNRRTE